MTDTPNPDAPVGDTTDLDEVRAAFIDWRDFEAQVARREPPTDEESGAAFDAWLAEHDRQVAARAWDEGARWALRDQGHEVTVYLADALAERNPYRIERQEGER